MKEKKSKINKLLRIIEIIFYSFSAFVIIFLLLSIISPKFKYDLIIIRSGSMEPTITTGSVSISKKQSGYAVGDIITFKNPEKQIITHRIVKTIDNENVSEFQTKGDNNKTEDVFTIEEKSVIGRVIFSIPFLGYIISFSKTALGIIIIFLVPAAWIIYGEIRKIKSEIKAKQQKQ